METDETMYHATPQTQGRVAHESVDKKTAKKGLEDSNNFYYCRLGGQSEPERRLEDSNNFYYCR